MKMTELGPGWHFVFGEIFDESQFLN